MAENTLVRDSLARHRTHLANERTLLAYLRTGLSFLLTAALVIRYSQAPISYIFTVILITLGLALLFAGVIKFIKVKTKIDRE